MVKDDDVSAGILDRRSVIERAAVVGAATAWVTPVVQSIASPAFAAGSPGAGDPDPFAAPESMCEDADPLAGAFLLAAESDPSFSWRRTVSGVGVRDAIGQKVVIMGAACTADGGDPQTLAEGPTEPQIFCKRPV